MVKKKAALCVIEAPAKINLHLKVGEKRSDGFHNIDSLFAAIGLSDTLRFECVEKGGCSLPEDNLVSRAVSRFRELTGFDVGLRIRLEKRIPIGAGLGGGSSDAASTLLALNALSGACVPLEKLREIAALLGSDVPFFLTGGAAFVSGRGEFVRPVKSPENLWVLLVMPPFSCDTANAFRLLDQARGTNIPGEPALAIAGKNLSAQELIQALEQDPETWPFFNDFLVTGNYQTIIDMLINKGASFAGLSGSGSCCFGIFKTKDQAEKVGKEILIPGFYVKVTFFLAHRADPVVQY
jgi:4-diphosphocytidyl-2-C-methyl-D-erythritol kinase